MRTEEEMVETLDVLFKRGLWVLLAPFMLVLLVVALLPIGLGWLATKAVEMTGGRWPK